MAGHGIVEPPADTASVELGEHTTAVGDTDDLEMVHSVCARIITKHSRGTAVQKLAIARGSISSGCVPFVETCELGRQNRRLQSIQAAVAPNQIVDVPAIGVATVVPERADFATKLRVVRRDRAGVSERA